MTPAPRPTRFGPVNTAEGTLFRLWAPSAESVTLLFAEGSRRPMGEGADGFFQVFVADVAPGQRYAYEVAGQRVADPASRLQDGDVCGWSVVCAPTVTQPVRRRRPWHEAVICEIHLGTVSPEGNFAGLAKRLPALAAAGYTVIELMPIADFPGARSWGYDGVLPFAPDEQYGTPAELRALIETAHGLGLSVMLDVVYNHFGPSGNFLGLYADRFFSPERHTPWGAAINFDEPLVRAFFVENACMWIEDYGFDGLRFDAVHAFVGDGADLLLREIAQAVREISADAYLVLENDHNAARWLTPAGQRPMLFDAQWNDDFHHVFHVLVTEEEHGYYIDYQEDPVAGAARVLSQGFLYQGEPSRHRDGEPRGEPSGHLHPACFVAFVQNHDQIGNRAHGERLSTLATTERLGLLRFALLLSPQIPLLFMGDEFGAAAPFQYFCDYDGDLADAIREGRKREFKSIGEETPDPTALATFERSRVDWHALDTGPGRDLLEQFRTLTALRRQIILPVLASEYRGVETDREATAVLCRWHFSAGSFALGLNLADTPARLAGCSRAAPAATVGAVAAQGGEVRLGPWSGIFWGPS